MNGLASEYSSGCDSGWTHYLEQSFLSPNDHHHAHSSTNLIESKTCCYSRGKEAVVEDDDDDEDLSMVSDASSGPPHLNDDSNNRSGHLSSVFEDSHSNSLVRQDGKRKKMNEERRGGRGSRKDQELASFLDDTASSPELDFSKKNFGLINKHQASINGVLENSQGFSATRFQGRSK